MSRTVFCKKYQQELEALDLPPFPGAKGQEILNSISKQAWQDWQKHQTMLINEKRLNLMELSARQFLSNEMDKFFSNADGLELVEGYVPIETPKAQ